MQNLKGEIDVLHKLCIEFSLFSLGIHYSVPSQENLVLIHETENRYPREYILISDILVARGDLNRCLGKITEIFIVKGK